MHFFLLALFAVLIAVADQISKILTVTYVLPAMPAGLPAIDGIFHFSYAENIGAAWSILQGARWLFVAIFVALTVLVLVEYFKKPMPFSTFERWCIAAIYGGAMGNIIDRIFRGFVVDMIHLDFMAFPVFNVADCFITCGCIALFVSLAFFNKQFWKDEKKLKEE